MTKATAKALDFSDVKDRGNFNTARVPAGDYLAKVVKVEDAKSQKDDEFQYIFTIKLSKFSQYAYPYYCKLTKEQLWKLRNLLIAAGLNVPKARLKVDPNKVLGKSIGVTMEDDEYKGREKSTIAAVFSAAELAAESGSDPVDDDDEDDADVDADVDAEDEPEEKPKKKDKGKKKKKSADVEELNLDDL